MDKNKKLSMFLLTSMLAMGMGDPNAILSPSNSRKSYTCKNCRKEFYPKSSNKTVNCSPKCEKEYYKL